jgi:hypothetical protein
MKILYFYSRVKKDGKIKTKNWPGLEMPEPINTKLKILYYNRNKQRMNSKETQIV